MLKLENFKVVKIEKKKLSQTNGGKCYKRSPVTGATIGVDDGDCSDYVDEVNNG